MAHWAYPIDPDCPAVKKYMTALMDDPMSGECGCLDDIVEAFEKKHRVKCKRCQEFGAANAGIED